jgi:hypothetical protein
LKRTNSGQVILEYPKRDDRDMLVMINDVLVDVLGRDLAFTVRVCVDTSAALNYPLGYAVALEEMLGRRRAAEVVSRIEDELRAEIGDLPATKWMHLPELVRSLRASYAGPVLLSMK